MAAGIAILEEPMLSTLPAFASIETAFARIVAAPTPTPFDARSVPGLPQRIIPPDELRELLTTETFDADVTDALWRQLACHARDWGEAWTLIAAGLALPALTRMSGQILHRANRNADDVASEMLAAFLAALRDTALEPPRLWLRLCWAAWRAGVRATRSEDTSELPAEVPTGSRSPTRPYGHPDLLLGRAVAGGILTPEQADLIGATRLGGVLLPQLAAQRNVSPGALRMQRARSEARLVAALRQGLLTVVPARPTGGDRPAGTAAGSRVRAAEPGVRAASACVRPAGPGVTTGEAGVRTGATGTPTVAARGR
jgi:hypothetical protein